MEMMTLTKNNICDIKKHDKFDSNNKMILGWSSDKWNVTKPKL